MYGRMDAPEIYDWEEDDIADTAVSPEQMTEWDAAEQEEQAFEQERYECPRCARGRDAAERRDVAYAGPDPELDARASPVSLGSDESVADVLERDDDHDVINFDADDFATLQRTGEHEGIYKRSVYCDHHDTVVLTYVGEGKGEIRDGALRPVLYV